jgi:hypothetical protein
MKIDMKEYEDKHRKMWKWLSEHPECGKEDYPKFDKDIKLYCYACQFVVDNTRYGSLDCGNCPIDWSTYVGFVDVHDLPCTNSYYDLWYASKNMKDRVCYAKIISELPWINKFEEEE